MRVVKPAGTVSPSGGREAQRRRTRRAILDAAQRLLQDGASPTIDDIAAAADVSRRTVYLYFPTLDQLLLDAAVGLLSTADIEASLDAPNVGTDARDRVEALARAIVAAGPATLPMGRQIIRLTIDRPTSDDPSIHRRGYRRVEWIERALAPARPQLTKGEFERLVSALSVFIGWEALTVLQDLRGLDRRHEADTVAWACRALVDAALNSSTRRRPARLPQK